MMDGSSDTGMTMDTGAMVDLAILVQDFSAGMNAPAPLAGASVRVESANGFTDATTDGSGTAHVVVDPTKGPYDVTAAMASYRAVSVLGIYQPLGTPILLAKNPVPSLALHSIGGTISGKTNAANSVQLDSYWFGTLVTKSASYQTSFFTASTSPPLPVTAFEVNAQNTIVNAVQTNAIMRPNGNTMVNVTLPGNANGFTTTMATLDFPSAGLVKGSDLTPGLSVGILGNGAVVKRNPNPRADMYVGIAEASTVTANASTVKIQSGTGSFAPDFWEAGYHTASDFVLIHSTQFSSPLVVVGQINTLAASGTTLDNAMFGTDAVGYDATRIVLQASVNNTPNECWTIWSGGNKLASHGVPHLPAAVKLADVGCTGTLVAFVAAAKMEGGSAAPWSETTKPVNVSTGTTLAGLGPGSRP